MIKLILYTWCLPQTLVAWVIRLFTRAVSKTVMKNIVVYNVTWESGSMSLSNKIFLCKYHWNDKKILMHETGHYKQSLILGWLYLLIIGLPSLMWAWWGFDLYNKHRQKQGLDKVSYYWFYTEKWANLLGGITDG